MSADCFAGRRLCDVWTENEPPAGAAFADAAGAYWRTSTATICAGVRSVWKEVVWNMETPTKRRANTKALRRQAEVAAVHFLIDQLGCVHSRRAIRTKWQKVDFFGADVVGVLETGAKIYAQVTTGAAAAVSVRRAKLAAFPWHPSETVLLLNLVATASPAKGRRTQYWFRVEELKRDLGHRKWVDWPEPVEVPREWFSGIAH